MSAAKPAKPTINVIDLELNSWPGRYTDGIVEIGIVEMMDDYTIGRTTSAFVRPPHGVVTDATIELTGLNPELILASAKLDVVVMRLCKEGFLSGKILASWGIDHDTLLSDLKTTNVNVPTTINVQTMYSVASGRRIHERVSLANACAECGIPSMGTRHTALPDAHQTALILQLILRDMATTRLRK